MGKIIIFLQLFPCFHGFRCFTPQQKTQTELYHYILPLLLLYDCYTTLLLSIAPWSHDFPTAFPMEVFPWFSPKALPPSWRPLAAARCRARSAASCGSSWRWPGWVKLGLPWKKSRFDHGFTRVLPWEKIVYQGLTMRKNCLPGFYHEKKLFTRVLPWEKVVYHGLTMKKNVYQGFTIRKSCLPWFDHEKKLFTMVWPWEKMFTKVLPWEKVVYHGLTMRKRCLPWFDHKKKLFTMVWPWENVVYHGLTMRKRCLPWFDQEKMVLWPWKLRYDGLFHQIVWGF